MGEDEEGEEGATALPGIFGGNFLVERKVFSFWIKDGFVRILEKFGKGERSISLSHDQVSWLLDSSRWLLTQSIGSVRHGNSISLAIGRNEKGVYIKIMVQRPDGFLFVPAGENGMAIQGFQDSLRNALPRHSPSGIGILQHKTYADILKPPSQSRETHNVTATQALDKGQAPQPLPLYHGYHQDLSLDSLFALMLALKEEIRLIRSLLPHLSDQSTVAALSSEAPPRSVVAEISPNSSHQETHLARWIVADPLSGIAHHFHTCDARAPLLSSRSSFLLDLSFEEQSGGLAESNRGSLKAVANGVIVPASSSFESNQECPTMDTRADSESHCFVPASKNSETQVTGDAKNPVAKDIESVDMSTVHDDIATSIDDYNTVESKDSIAFEVEIPSVRATKTTSRYTARKVNAWKQQLARRNDMSEIVMDRHGETYRHAPSGMRYDPKENRFFTWVSNQPSDLRAIYYDVSNGYFKLATSGRNGELNKKVLRDQDWDRKFIYTKESEGFHPKVYEFFQRKLGDL